MLLLLLYRHLYQFSKVFVGEELPAQPQTSSTAGAEPSHTSSHDENGSSSADGRGLTHALKHETSTVLDTSLTNAGSAHEDDSSIGKSGITRRRSERLLLRPSLSDELNSLLRVMWAGKISLVSPHNMLNA